MEDRYPNPRSGGIVAVNRAERAITFRLSTPEIDNQNEFALPEDWVLTERFKANPVALWNHRQDLYPIGTCSRPDGSLAFWTNREGVFVTVYFTDAHEDARAIYKMYEDRSLRGVSPGFHTRQVVPMDYATARTKGALGPPRGAGRVHQLRQNELFEVSAVPVPSCASALALPVIGKSFHGIRLSPAVAKPLADAVGKILAAGVDGSVSSPARIKTGVMTHADTAPGVLPLANSPDPAVPVVAPAPAAPVAVAAAPEPVPLTPAPPAPASPNAAAPDLSSLVQAIALHAEAIDQLNATIQARDSTIAELKSQLDATAALAARHEQEDFPRIARLISPAAA